MPINSRMEELQYGLAVGEVYRRRALCVMSLNLPNSATTIIPFDSKTSESSESQTDLSKSVYLVSTASK